ncbi:MULTISPECIES: acyl-CoA synthetase [Mycobacterium avium complex (MAC)]|uniref:Acyl-CoA synthetase n=3 Tax=Mycobacterium avium complex (MAC) TaxID=120793 RepID=A0ABX3TT71_9MYCO|nr:MULTISPECIES: acyl-CoA synthetase [Mycobacterium avium complex (MAC)]ETA93434.1 acyl-CoA synthetase [Mycobacterium avium 05-4293]ETB11272.1 acyl-CoA synthetase [Mycobacterium avium subsp. silvaticum ATCC 49884]ETB18210.1 acyl-CoA synthetase [Mycobacterium avium subsp. avium 10-9275]ETB26624.1 acyl-CoA synthetase [Mycobacterium avium 09-5983]ETB42714.1 acyl-CoA synthetase [Mycobacterium avium subsp. hominissuis 10-5606]TXA39765.1 acyl-CoA synthetase [Mycobacterium tuberculosis variant bovis
MSEWTIGAVLDEIADVIPDRTMTVCGDRRSTFAESADRTRRLANFLSGNGLGVHRERAVLQNWECGQDRVALVMHNDLYPDMVVGCLKARTVPVNVNYHYTPREVGELFDYLRPRAVIYHRGLGPKFADVLGRGDVDLLIAVDDGSEAPQLPGAVSLNDALAQGDTGHPVPGSPDDLLMICTGGTTGRPKGVLWRQSDIYVSSMVGADHACAQEIRDKVSGAAGAPWFAVSPLMHAAGMWTAFAAIMSGTTVVLYDTGKKLDPRSVWETAQRERVGMMTMVGDAYAAPLVAELRRGSYDLSSLYAIGTGGAATNAKYQQALLELLPHITLINGYGSSETGNMGFGHSRTGTRTDTFTLREGGLVLAEDYSRFLSPGEPQLGWVAREGRIPLGYFDDPDATRKTFPVIDGKQVVISGDRAALEPDGTLRLFGRDSLVVNTGGEKVFVEEVEEVLRAHPAVADALVVGRPSGRWGEEIVALVELRAGTGAAADELHAHCTSRLARFKAPKEFLFVAAVQRLGNGKADYRWAKRHAVTEASEKAPMST